MKAIIFDCFGVLCLSWEQQLYQENLPQYETARPQLEDISKQSDYGFIDQFQANMLVAETLGINLSDVEQYKSRSHRLNQPLIDYSQTLRPRFKLGLLSNISRDGIEPYFSTSYIERLFDASLVSGDVGMIKPDPNIFKLMAERLGVYPGECLMIDDLEANCDGADAAGMKAILYKNNPATIQAIEKMLKSYDKIASTEGE